MRTKLTDAAIRSYEPRPAQYTIGDAACPGLCIRITPKGVKSFAFAYRNKATGKVGWLTIGRYPDVSLTRAREAANDARKTAANGGTPLAPKAGRAGTERKAKSYGEVVEVYYAERLKATRLGRCGLIPCRQLPQSEYRTPITAVTNAGRSAWFGGVLMLAVYIGFAMTLYLLPPRV